MGGCHWHTKPIAHGYFDIDGDIVYDVVKNDLADLLQAIDYFLDKDSYL